MSALEPLPFWPPAPAATRVDESADRLHALVAIAKVVASAEAFDDVLRLTAAEARAALGAASLSLSVWERERGWLRVVLNVGDLGPVEQPDGTGEVYPVTEYSCIEALLDSRPYVQQVDADPSTPGYDAAVVGLLRDLGKGSCMGVPVVLEGRVWGELFATRYPGDRPYGREDLDFAGAVAGQIAAGAAQVRHLEQVARLAYTDELTGLANRRAIEDRLDAAIARHRATGSSVSLIIADVNGLKRINDDRGHEAGDRALVHVSGLLSASAGLVPGSLAGRLSGDEFCIVLEDVAADHAVWVAEDLCRRAKAGLDEGVACGVASTGDPVGVIDSRKRLFRLADAAQSRAKRSRSRGPVVAGRGLPEDATVRFADRARGSGEDRRSVRSRDTSDSVRVLEDVLATLDHGGAVGPEERLELVADSVARLVDAAAWWVSYAEPGAGT
ncbi:MAG TPA: GGDEF domain-containing protein, partial [Candidatus Limnocylindria bacterium]|nr:GGDEF domain-containing protein [Candidatus Limnocylindria bacterium]